MSKRPRHSAPGDWHLWLDVRKTVTPLRDVTDFESHVPTLPIPADAPKPPPKFVRALWKGPALPSYSPPVSQPGPHKDAGRVIEPRMRRRLMRGQIEIDGTIDLHGLRQDEAHSALKRFVTARAARGDRTILVITGKGLKKVDGDAARIIERGVLRAMLPIWLSDATLGPLVAGWDQAAQGHGGEGAFYVRLKRGAP